MAEEDTLEARARALTRAATQQIIATWALIDGGKRIRSTLRNY